MFPHVDGLLGSVIAGYRLERVLSTGATGVVFLGRSTTVLQERAAIKILIPPWQGSAEDRANFQARFLREAETLQRLRHPRILSIRAFGEEAGLNYMVLPYMEGGTLSTGLGKQGGSLTLQQIALYLTQIADALDYAHRQGVVHRDIKPGNLLLDALGQLYLADFSIVRLLDATRTTLTGTGQVMGTPAYLSPEQAFGKQVGPATDIYSLGVVIYELVTGQVPFQGSSFVEVIRQQVQDPPPPPRLFRRDLPEAAEAVLLQALAKQPQERFSSAGAFAQAFIVGMQGRWPPGVRAPGSPVSSATRPFTPPPTVGTPPPTMLRKPPRPESSPTLSQPTLARPPVPAPGASTPVAAQKTLAAATPSAPPVQQTSPAPPAAPPIHIFTSPSPPARQRSCLVPTLLLLILLVMLSGGGVVALGCVGQGPFQTLRPCLQNAHQVPPSDTPSPAWPIYRSTDEAFSLTYPPNWQARPQNQSGGNIVEFDGPGKQTFAVDDLTNSQGQDPTSIDNQICTSNGARPTRGPSSVSIGNQTWIQEECDVSSNSSADHALVNSIIHNGAVFIMLEYATGADFSTARTMYFLPMEGSFEFLI